MKLIAFSASSSRKSINKKLVAYASSLLDSFTVEIIDINDYELPLFSEDKEAEIGKPELAKQFLEKIEGADAVIISFAEHNGTYTTAYKNLFDWCSRINPKVYLNKPMVLLSTSPGPGGARNVLEVASQSMPHFGGEVVGRFSLPSFYDNFDLDSNKITNAELAAELNDVVQGLKA
ncbi:MAG: NADPH-dependent FMN reductase [Gammaproteobacteria bacterium]|nr:MAG: NADPH-dependent FMN reductase [Gammaproteobacteria bacterium]